MKKALVFRIDYFILMLLLLVIEVLIALYVHDAIIRPYIGDVLVVILIYCFVKSFINIPVWQAATGTLVFSFLIEILQYFNIVNRLGLGHSKLARIVIGSSFEWTDLLAYTAGFIIILITEYLRTGSMRKPGRA